jgi:hypothetical protein
MIVRITWGFYVDLSTLNAIIAARMSGDITLDEVSELMIACRRRDMVAHE